MAGAVNDNLEFPPFPKNFDDLSISPSPLRVKSGEWQSSITIKNLSSTGILFKVKCSSNKRIEISDCVDILHPNSEISVELKKKIKEKSADQLLVVFVLVGKQWMQPEVSGYKCWQRVKDRDIPVKSTVINIIEQ